jgi:hypothetical protein
MRRSGPAGPANPLAASGRARPAHKPRLKAEAARMAARGMSPATSTPKRQEHPDAGCGAVCEAALTAIGVTVAVCGGSVARQPKTHRDPFWPAAAIRGWRGHPDVVSAKVTELLRVGRTRDSDPDADPGAERPANDPYLARSGGRVRCDAGR